MVAVPLVGALDGQVPCEEIGNLGVARGASVRLTAFVGDDGEDDAAAVLASVYLDLRDACRDLGVCPPCEFEQGPFRAVLELAPARPPAAPP